jgi:hypothetical protein
MLPRSTVRFEYGPASAGRTFIIDEKRPVAACREFPHRSQRIIHDLVTSRQDALFSYRSVGGQPHSVPLAHNSGTTSIILLLRGFTVAMG